MNAPCDHTDVTLVLDYEVDEEQMCVFVYSVRCSRCGAIAKAQEPEVVLNDWEQA